MFYMDKVIESAETYNLALANWRRVPCVEHAARVKYNKAYIDGITDISATLGTYLTFTYNELGFITSVSNEGRGHKPIVAKVSGAISLGDRF